MSSNKILAIIGTVFLGLAVAGGLTAFVMIITTKGIGANIGAGFAILFAMLSAAIMVILYLSAAIVWWYRKTHAHREIYSTRPGAPIRPKTLRS